MDFGSCVTWRSKFVWCFLGTFLDQYNSNLNLRGAGSVYNDVNCDAKLSCRMGLQSQRQYRLTIFKSTFTSFCWYHLLELQVWTHGPGLQFKSSWLRSLAVTGKTHIGYFRQRSPKSLRPLIIWTLSTVLFLLWRLLSSPTSLSWFKCHTWDWWISPGRLFLLLCDLSHHHLAAT